MRVPHRQGAWYHVKYAKYVRLARLGELYHWIPGFGTMSPMKIITLEELGDTGLTEV